MKIRLQETICSQADRVVAASIVPEPSTAITTGEAPVANPAPGNILLVWYTSNECFVALLCLEGAEREVGFVFRETRKTR